MINDDNTVKIGRVLKWRSTYDSNKKYYQENIVTMCGCVFRCKVLQTQDKPPIENIDSDGHISYINQDTWDVVVDMLYYWNFVIDANVRYRQTWEYIDMVEAENQRQQEEINQLQEHDREQDARMDRIEEKHAEDMLALEGRLNDWMDETNGNIQAINSQLGAISRTLSEQEALNAQTAEQIAQLASKNASLEEALENQRNEYLAQLQNLRDSFDQQLRDLYEQLNNGQASLTYPYVLKDGTWRDDLYWDNEKPWSSGNDSLHAESYDEESETVFLSLVSHEYMEDTEALALKNVSYIYDEPEEQLTFT